MNWRAHLQKGDEHVVQPWVGGRELVTQKEAYRRWRIEGRLPREHGWYKFKVEARTATVVEPAEPDSQALGKREDGYLVGNLFVGDQDARAGQAKPEDLAGLFEPVYLVDPGLDRFSRVRVARPFKDGPLIFAGQGFPLGPEEDVLNAYLDKEKSVTQIPGVIPSLDLAFRIETWRRAEAERRRREEEERRRLEEEIRQREARRQELIEQHGDGQRRRELAGIDFEEAARAALAVGGAELLDCRDSGYRNNEKIVRYRVEGRRLECVVNARTLGILDAGVCLTDHDTGERGDTWLTLESLPGVIREALNTGRLVVWRHV
jgi:hypothetical protein